MLGEEVLVTPYGVEGLAMRVWAGDRPGFLGDAWSFDAGQGWKLQGFRAGVQSRGLEQGL